MGTAGRPPAMVGAAPSRLTHARITSRGPNSLEWPSMGLLQDLLYPFRRPTPPAPRAATGFFTDTTLCIGCKACEVACKQWNQLPSDGFHFTGDSYDNTRMLSATTWRHVTFVEQFPALAEHPPAPAAANFETPLNEGPAGRWLMMSDVCKHCSAAPWAIP